MPSLKSVAVFALVWIASFAWRPFVLGFYSDDYELILRPLSAGLTSEQLLHFYEHIFDTRPLSALLAYGFTLACGSDSFSWHAAAALNCLAVGVLIWLVLRDLNLLGQPLSETWIACIASVWFVLPTNFGFVSWPNHVPQSFVMNLFLLSFFFLIWKPVRVGGSTMPLVPTLLAFAAHRLSDPRELLFPVSGSLCRNRRCHQRPEPALEAASRVAVAVHRGSDRGDTPAILSPAHSPGFHLDLGLLRY